jgi:hypothetical protein
MSRGASFAYESRTSPHRRPGPGSWEKRNGVPEETRAIREARIATHQSRWMIILLHLDRFKRSSFSALVFRKHQRREEDSGAAQGFAY